MTRRTSRTLYVALGIAALAFVLALPASAHDIDDFTLHDPSLSVRLLFEVGQSEDDSALPPPDGLTSAFTPFRSFDPSIKWLPAGDGAKVVRTVADPDLGGPYWTRLWRRVSHTGTVTDLFSYNMYGEGGSQVCEALGRESFDPFEGTMWIVTSRDTAELGECDMRQVWLVEGLPRTRSAGECPSSPGDLAPGELDEGTEPPTWRPTGDGSVNVGDVIALMRAAVDLQTIDCGP